MKMLKEKKEEKKQKKISKETRLQHHHQPPSGAGVDKFVDKGLGFRVSGLGARELEKRDPSPESRDPHCTVRVAWNSKFCKEPIDDPSYSSPFGRVRDRVRISWTEKRNSDLSEKVCSLQLKSFISHRGLRDTEGGTFRQD